MTNHTNPISGSAAPAEYPPAAPPDQNNLLPDTRDPALDRFARLGKWLALAESGADTELARGAGAALRMYYAEGLGLPPFAATELYLRGGRLISSAKLIRALAQRAGYQVVRVNETQDSVTAAIFEGGKELGRTTFTLEMAKRAGIVGGGTWQKYPQRMLWARASKYVIDDYAAHVTIGIMSEEEAETLEAEAIELPEIREPVESLDVGKKTVEAPKSQPGADPEPRPGQAQKTMIVQPAPEVPRNDPKTFEEMLPEGVKRRPRKTNGD